MTITVGTKVHASPLVIRQTNFDNNIENVRLIMDDLPKSRLYKLQKFSWRDMEKVSNIVKEENKQKYKHVLHDTTNFLLSKIPGALNSTAAEWSVFGIGRSGVEVPKKYKKDYKMKLHEAISKELNKSRAFGGRITDVQRAVIALSSLGYDYSSVAGKNLLDYTWNKEKYFPNLNVTQASLGGRQGLNELVYGLLNIDLQQTPTPDNATISREDIIKQILTYQTPDGSFSLMENNSSGEIDITAMTITSLAPYYPNIEAVQQSVDKAIQYISKSQNENAGFSDIYSETLETTAQVIVALCSLNIDCEKDERFIKNENTLLTNLLSYYKENGQFSHLQNAPMDFMGTEQAHYALVAYDRFINDQENIYDMKNVELEKASSIFMSIEARTAGHGDLLSMIEFPIENGDNVESIFTKVAKENNIEFTFLENSRPDFDEIEGIANGEYDFNSSWTYYINGELLLNDDYIPKPGDVIRIRYTLDFEDLDQPLVKLLKKKISQIKDMYYPTIYSEKSFKVLQESIATAQSIASDWMNNGYDTESELIVSSALGQLFAAVDQLEYNSDLLTSSLKIIQNNNQNNNEVTEIIMIDDLFEVDEFLEEQLL